MTQTFTLPEEVTNARKTAAELTGQASEYAAGEPTITDVLRQKVQEAYANNVDVTTGLDTATGNYLASPSAARVKYEGVFNPFQREALVDQYTSNAMLPMLSYSSLYGQRLGRIEDLIGAGTNAYKATSARATSKATAANDLYTNLLNEYLQLEGLRQQERQLDISEEKGAGGDSFDFGSLADLLNLLNPEETTGATPTEPQPLNPPYNWQERPGILWRSPEGQWAWDSESENWVPIGE